MKAANGVGHGSAGSGPQRIRRLCRFLRASRVPAVYLTRANSLFLTFLAFYEINDLRTISQARNSDFAHALTFALVDPPGRADGCIPAP